MTPVNAHITPFEDAETAVLVEYESDQNTIPTPPHRTMVGRMDALGMTER
jgi:hypothetical protein